MKRFAWGGVIGPVVFIAGWLIIGLLRNDYSSMSEPISELARIDTSAHVAMTLVLGAYAMGILLFACATTNPVALVHALATGAVAAFPLGGADTAHFVSAAIAYITLALLPLTMKRSASALCVTLLIAVALTTSVIVPDGTDGFFQRLGFTIGDVWIVLTSLRIIGVRVPGYR